MANIYRILEAEHRQLQTLVSKLAAPPDQASFDHEGRRRLADYVVALASRHEALEELVFWPVVRQRVPDGRAIVDRALAEEKDARYVVDALRFARSEASITDLALELRRLLEDHVHTEERVVWPALQHRMTRIGAAVLGAEFRLAGPTAPTRPHPGGPYHRLGFLTIGPAVALLDRLRDRLSGRSGTRYLSIDISDSADPLAVLAEDHAAIKYLVDTLQRHETPDPRMVAELVAVLSAHDSIEREHLYPLLRVRLDGGGEAYEEWLADHGEVAELASEIDRFGADTRYLKDLLVRLEAALIPHVDREDRRLLPELRSHLTDVELAELGSALRAAKSKAPTRPHAHLSGAGSGERWLRMVESPIDRARDRLARRT